MEALDRTPGSYVSRQHLRMLVAPSQGGVRSASTYGAVLFADVVGFTAHTQKLSQRGGLGIEEVGDAIHLLFTRIIETCLELGGDVIALAGDAIWVMWPNPESNDREGSQSASVAAAARAGLALQKELEETVGGESFQLRVSVGTGSLDFFEFGEQRGATDFVVSGAAVSDAAAADRTSKVGGVVASAAAWDTIRAFAKGRGGEGGVFEVLEVSDSSPPREEDELPITAASLQRVRATLPPAVTRRAGAERSELAQFRTLSVLFINISGVALDNLDAATLSASISSVRGEAERAGGHVYQTLLDEKGLTQIVVFGLPFQAHDDSALRATRVAMGVAKRLQSAGIGASIGVTSGQAYCATHGTPVRRQYAIVGSVMNMAARLMAQADGNILCDAATVELVKTRTSLNFQSLPPIRVKGRSDLVRVYRPQNDATLSPLDFSSGSMTGGAISREELQVLCDALAEPSGQTFLIEGGAGMGKSHLVDQTVEAAIERGARCLLGIADSIDRATPYRAFRTVFEQILGVPNGPTDKDEVRHSCITKLEAAGISIQRLALVNVVLPGVGEENEHTKALKDEARAEATRHLLLALLAAESKCRRTLLVIEDVQWLDASSWILLQRIVDQLGEVMVVLTADTDRDSALESEYLEPFPKLVRMQLEPLSGDEIVRLACEHLGVDRIPPVAAEEIRRRSGGNPFYAVELATALRDYGILIISGDRSSLGDGIRDASAAFGEALEARGLPATLAGIAMNRVDRLEPSQQSLLRVASAMGAEFSVAFLERLLPEGLSDASTSILSHLVQEGILRGSADRLETKFAFSHAITRDAVYGTIPYAQRRELHSTIAAIYREGWVPPQLHALVAHHLKRAGEFVESVQFLASAGDEALRQYAHGEAISLFSDALELDDEYPDTDLEAAETRRRRARWELNIGRAYVNWCRYVESRDHLEAGLVPLSARVPSTDLGIGFGLLRQVFRQFIHRMFPSRFVGTGGSLRSDLLRCAHAHEGLAETYFNTGENLRCLYAALASVNLAERAGVSPELARGYSSIGAILGFMPAPQLATSYLERGLETANEAGDTAALAWVKVATGVYQAGVGDWDSATNNFEETLRISDEMGDRRRSDDARQNLAAMAWFGGNIDESLKIGEALRASATLRADAYMEAEGVRRIAWCLLAQQRPTEAVEYIERLDELRLEDLDKSLGQRHIDKHVLRASLHMMRGEMSGARKEASSALEIVATIDPMFYDIVLEYSSLAEILLRLRKSGAEVSDRSLRTMRKKLKGLARVFPIAEPAALLWEGVALSLAGNVKKSAELWRRASERASELRLPRYEALADLELGRHAPGGSDERLKRLSTAETTFKQIRDLQHLDEALEALRTRH